MTGFEFEERQDDRKGTNRSAPIKKCDTCGGDRFVTVRLRSTQTSPWMEEHGIRATANAFHEEVAACPKCNHTEVEYFRHGRSKFRMMDPATVRQALQLPS